MSERSKEHDSKSCEATTSESSNLSSSAERSSPPATGGDIFFCFFFSGSSRQSFSDVKKGARLFKFERILRQKNNISIRKVGCNACKACVQLGCAIGFDVAGADYFGDCHVCDSHAEYRAGYCRHEVRD